MSYNLGSIPQIDQLLYDSTNRNDVAKSLNLKHNVWKHKNGSNYHILKYNKEWLSRELVSSHGLLRSLIYKDDGSVVCFAPPKSLPVIELNIDMKNKYVAETFVEGTMINVFYDKQTASWEIATRSSVGGEACFFMENGFKPENTFKYMFDEVCQHIGLNVNTLNTRYVYSFVIQHPRNRIVQIIKEMKLYLVEMYEIVDNKTINIVVVNSADELDSYGIPKTICLPIRTPIHDELELKQCLETLVSSNTPYHIVGVVIKNSLGERYKYRNPNYEHVRHLRGNQPKLQFQYLSLRQEGKVGEYLQYYREHRGVFNEFRNVIHDYTNELFQNYVKCYIKKEKQLTEFPEKFRTHMYYLHHELYLKTLMPVNKYINKIEVINYFNHLHPAKQMFTLNYDVRKQFKDDEKMTGV